MITYYQTATRNSPEVKINAKDGVIELKGSSSPENVRKFYEPIFNEIDKFEQIGSDSITASFNMEYFNTGTSKCFFVILKKLKKLEKQGLEVRVHWFYEEDDECMYEIGEDYQSVLDLPFDFKEISVDY